MRLLRRARSGPTESAKTSDAPADGDALNAAEDALDAAEVDRVRAVLFLNGVPSDGLDDGVQQVCLKLLEHHSGGAAPLHNRHAWLGVVASRVAVDWHRSRTRERDLSERLASRPSAPSHPQEDATLATAIASGLDELPASQRQILVLRFYDDMAVRDIAETLEIAEGTVKSRLHHAVKAIRERLTALEVI